MNWNLPDGYHASPLAPEHKQNAVEVINAYWQWMNGGNFTTLEEMQTDWQDPDFDVAADTQIVTGPDGRLVAYADLWNISKLRVRQFYFPAVDPQHLGQGIEDYLVEWALRRGRENMLQSLEGARVVMHANANVTCQPVRNVLERHAGQVVRHSYRMRIDFNQPPAPAVVPEGFVIRPMIAGQEERAVCYAVYDSFRDHWGFVEEPFEDFYKGWLYRFESDADYDPSLIFVALDGDEVAGISMCHAKFEEVPGMGWVGTLGVRRPWRKNGIGLALLQHSFAEFYKRGSTSVGLGVDAQNLTGALRLYEKAGMHVWRESCTYEFELRPGKDLMRQNLEAAPAKV